VCLITRRTASARLSSWARENFPYSFKAALRAAARLRSGPRFAAVRSSPPALTIMNRGALAGESTCQCGLTVSLLS
jgi:hypothetical protein